MAALVPPPTTSFANGASVETLIPPRVPGVGITVGRAATAATGARVAGRGDAVAASIGTVAGVVVADAMGVSTSSAAESGKGVGGWATAVGSTVGVLVGNGVSSGAGIGANVRVSVGCGVPGVGATVGGLAGEGVRSGTGVGMDVVCGGVGCGVVGVEGISEQPHSTLSSVAVVTSKYAPPSSSMPSIPSWKCA